MLFFLWSCISDPILNQEGVSLDEVEVNIQHLHTQPEFKDGAQGIQIWATSGVDWIEPLSTLFDTSPIVNASQLKDNHILIMPVLKGVPLPHFKSKRVVSVLEGEWSTKETHSILKFSEGLIDLDKSISRYTVPSFVTRETKAITIAQEVINHYGINSQSVPDSWRLHIDKGLWSSLNSEWLEPHPTDLRIRSIEKIETADAINILSQFRLGWSDSDVRQLIKHQDAWVRAQTAILIENPQYLIYLANDKSSVVRVAALHQMGQNSANESGCKWSKNEVEQTGLPSCKEYCKPFISASRHQDAYVRWKAAYGLQFCKSETGELIRLLTDLDIDVQREAIHSLQRHTLNTVQVDSVLQLTQSSNSFVRRWAWETVVTLPIESKSNLLDCMIEESSTLAKQVCAKALNELGIQTVIPKYQPPNTTVLSNPELAVNNTDPTYRKDLAKYFAGRPELLTYLEVLLSDTDGEVRKTAAEALGYSRSTLVWDAVKDSDPDVVIAALESIRIGQITGPIETIFPLLSHTDTEVVLRTVEALVALESKWTTETEQIMKRFVDHPDERVRGSLSSRYPYWFTDTEPSIYVRWMAIQSNSPKIPIYFSDIWILERPEYRFWMQGIIQDQDDLVHDIFSWTNPNDRPQSHRALRPPRFGDYGHPNRG